VRDHVGRCGACAAFHRTTLAVHAELTRSAREGKDEAPAGLTERLMAAWPDMLPTERPVTSGPIFRLRPVMAACLVVVFLLTSVMMFDQTQTESTESGYSLARLDAVVGEEVPGAQLEKLSLLAETLMVEEMDRLQRDADALARVIAECLRSDVPKPLLAPLMKLFNGE
jgi:hypothetical protein